MLPWSRSSPMSIAAARLDRTSPAMRQPTLLCAIDSTLVRDNTSTAPWRHRVSNGRWRCAAALACRSPRAPPMHTDKGADDRPSRATANARKGHEDPSNAVRRTCVFAPPRRFRDSRRGRLAGRRTSPTTRRRERRRRARATSITTARRQAGEGCRRRCSWTRLVAALSGRFRRISGRNEYFQPLRGIIMHRVHAYLIDQNIVDGALFGVGAGGTTRATPTGAAAPA